MQKNTHIDKKFCNCFHLDVNLTLMSRKVDLAVKGSSVKTNGLKVLHPYSCLIDVI